MNREIQQQLQWVKLYETSGDAGFVCRRCGIARPTLRKWWCRYLAQGIAGLESHSRRLKRSPSTKTGAIQTQEKRPLVTTFCGLSLTWQKDAIITDNPKQVFNGLRSEIVSRLLAQTRELCGDTDGPFEVHHIRRLSDLNQSGRQNNPMWVKIMASRRRKTIVVCVRCHEDIHRVRTAKDQER